MNRLNFAFICERASVSDKDNALEVRNPFSVVVAPNKPAIHKGASIVVNFMPGDTNKHSLGIKIKSPSKKEMIPPYRIDLGPAQNNKAGLGHILGIPQLTLDEEGDYIVEIEVDGKILHNIPFSFNLR